MNFRHGFAGEQEKNAEEKVVCALMADEGLDLKPEPELDEALRAFRLSVHAWSAAAYSRPLVSSARRPAWRLAAACALGCALLAAGVSGGFYSHLHRQPAAALELTPQVTRIAAESRAAVPERPVAAQPTRQVGKEEEELLAKVDSDVSRPVPVVLEPLAQLMAGDVTQ
jgi:hypothetical protein